MNAIKLAIFYASYAAPLAVAAAIFVAATRQGAWRIGALAVAVGAALFSYSRFVEPRLLVVKEHDIALKRCVSEGGAMRLVVFADTHLGLFPHAMPISRIVARVNELAGDAVLIPGDFTYYPNVEDLQALFTQLADVEAPVYAVLGNHDVGIPGPNYTTPLWASLKSAGVINIENSAARQTINGRAIEFAGLSDLWEERQDWRVFDMPSPVPRIGVVHIPETINFFKDETTVDLLIAGHTHGGQVNLYGLTCLLKPMACRVAREGFEQTPQADVFITTGTGMVGLPIRFNIPPRIDVLNITYRACPGPTAQKQT